MAIVFLVAGIVLLVGAGEVCAKAEEILKAQGAPEERVMAVELKLQNASTMLTNILLLVGGVAGSSVILSLRMKDKLCARSVAVTRTVLWYGTVGCNI